MTFKFFHYKKNDFKRELCNQNISSLVEIDDVNELAKQFQEIILNIVEKFTTIKIIRKNKWFDDELYSLEKQKIELYERNEDWLEYRKVENQFKNKIKLAKSNYLKERIVANKGDQKGMLKELDDIVSEKNEPEKIGIIFNGEPINTDKEIVERFNKYFIDSIKDIVNSISHVQFSYTGPKTESIFKFKIIDSKQLKEIINNQNNKRDTNLMTARMIVDCFNIVGPDLLRIVNLSLETGTFPECWKETIVVPAEKVEGTNKCEEFRPINMLPVYEKILEQVVKLQLEKYLDDGGLLVKQQSGFRKGYSCETALNWLITEWKYEIDRKKFIFVVKLDLKRAFETVNREILIKKLQNYGIRDTECSWFQSYLENRTQRTRRNGEISDRLKCDDGVPQGSVLGVMLFTLYVNDMQAAVKNCKLRQYGDDTLIYIIGDDEDKCHELIKDDLKTLENWLCMNKLKINAKKTECMVMNCNFITDLCIDEENVAQVNEIKYLGVIIDKFLKFDKHVDRLYSRIQTRVNLLTKIRNEIVNDNLINDNLIDVYNTTVLLRLDYCSTILFTMSNDDIQRFQSLQNEAMRVILGYDDNTESHVMLNKLKWLSVKQRLNYHILMFIFKMKKGLLPKYLIINDKNKQNTVLNQELIMCNDLTNWINTANDLNSLKRLVKPHLLENNKATLEGTHNCIVKKIGENISSN